MYKVLSRDPYSFWISKPMISKCNYFAGKQITDVKFLLQHREPFFPKIHKLNSSCGSSRPESVSARKCIFKNKLFLSLAFSLFRSLSISLFLSFTLSLLALSLIVYFDLSLSLYPSVGKSSDKYKRLKAPVPNLKNVYRIEIKMYL